MRRLAREVRLSGSPRQTAERMFQIDPQFGNSLPAEGQEAGAGRQPASCGRGADERRSGAAERYRLWCQDVHGVYGDCLGGALVAGRYLDMQGRYIWALALSKSPVLDEMKKALGEMVEVRELINSALWTLGSMLLILALNPVAPALVAVVGLGLVLYVGEDTLHDLVAGGLELMEAVKVATTFGAVPRGGRALREDSGARGGEGVGHAADGGDRLHGAGVRGEGGDAAWLGAGGRAGRGRGGAPPSALGVVEELALSSEGVSVTVAANAMTMRARGTGGTGPAWRRTTSPPSATTRPPRVGARGRRGSGRSSPRRGCRWRTRRTRCRWRGTTALTPSGITRSSSRNWTRQRRPVGTSWSAGEALTGALKGLAKQIATPGTELNQLVTRQQPR